VNTQFKSSFAKDLRRLKNKDLLTRVHDLITSVEQALSLEDVSNIKRLSSTGPYYRIRIGDYHVGLVVESDIVTFVRFLHRKEIYRYFP
jgi:mRNA interferase RelE/StbE